MTFEELVEQYEPMIYRLMRRNHVFRDHDEYIQLSKIAMWDVYHKFNPTKGDLAPFFYVAINRAIQNQIRREVKRASMSMMNGIRVLSLLKKGGKQKNL